MRVGNVSFSFPSFDGLCIICKRISKYADFEILKFVTLKIRHFKAYWSLGVPPVFMCFVFV